MFDGHCPINYQLCLVSSRNQDNCFNYFSSRALAKGVFAAVARALKQVWLDNSQVFIDCHGINLNGPSQLIYWGELPVINQVRLVNSRILANSQCTNPSVYIQLTCMFEETGLVLAQVCLVNSHV